MIFVASPIRLTSLFSLLKGSRVLELNRSAFALVLKRRTFLS